MGKETQLIIVALGEKITALENTLGTMEYGVFWMAVKKEIDDYTALLNKIVMAV